MNRLGFRRHFRAGENAAVWTVPEKRLGMTADFQIAYAGAKGIGRFDQTPGPTLALASDMTAGIRAGHGFASDGGNGRVC